MATSVCGANLCLVPFLAPLAAHAPRGRITILQILVAIAGTLVNPAVTAPVLGVRTVGQLKDRHNAPGTCARSRSMRD